jgi:hypothetical protein
MWQQIFCFIFQFASLCLPSNKHIALGLDESDGGNDIFENEHDEDLLF